MTANLSLTYGSLLLTDSPYLIEFGMDTGAPENTYEALAFFLQDGEMELSSRASNRTLSFNVLIEGADLAEMAEAEAALVAETEKPLNTLTLDPGDYGAPTVYEVFRAQVALARDDNGEIARLRRYTVTVRALPFPTSQDEVVAAALGVTGSTTTLVDNGSATTNWTGAVDGVTTSPAVSSGAVGVTTSALDGDVTVTLTRAATVNTSSTKYLAVDWIKESTSDYLTAKGDGVVLPKISEAPSPTAGRVRSTFYAAAASVASLELTLLSSGATD